MRYHIPTVTTQVNKMSDPIFDIISYIERATAAAMQAASLREAHSVLMATLDHSCPSEIDSLETALNCLDFTEAGRALHKLREDYLEFYGDDAA